MRIGRDIIAGVVMFGQMAACSHPAQLRDQWQASERRLSFEKWLQRASAAPLIVLGRVLSVDKIGQPQRSQGDAQVKTELTRIRIDVEQEIKGVIPANPMEFYFFELSEESDVGAGVPAYMPVAGQRRIYFLRAEAGRYRSVGDVARFNLEVWNGTHEPGFCRGMSPGRCVSELLLAPAGITNVEAFVSGLWPSAYASAILSSPENTKELLDKLGKYPDARIAKGASETLQMLEQWWPSLKKENVHNDK